MKLFMFVVVALVLSVGVTFGQIPVSIPITANVASAGIAIAAGAVSLDGLTPGITASIVPDGIGGWVLNPDGTGGVATTVVDGGSAPSEITADPNAALLVSFVLPNRLYATAGGGYVNVSFSAASAAWGSPGASLYGNYFDPHTPTTMITDAGGLVDIYLGCTVQVPANAQTDLYGGEALVTATYTGL